MAITNILRTNVGVGVTSNAKLTITRRRHDDVTVTDWVEEQFPEFVRSDYPRMIEFIKAYYSYITTRTENGEIDDIKDIDETSGDYILRLRKEFSYNAAEFDFLEEKNFIRHAKEFYASKGTDESIKFLFRVLFDDDVELEYPSSRIFTPSDGKWVQLKSLKVRLQPNSISPLNFIGSFLTLRNAKDIKQVIEVYDVAALPSENQAEEDASDFEIFYTTEVFINIDINDHVIGENFDGIIIPSLSRVKVLIPGANFKVGQVIKLEGVVGEGAVGVISRVDKNGSVKNIKIIKFGKAYTTNFYVAIKPEGVFADAGTTFEGISQDPNTINTGVEDAQTDYQEDINIFKSDYVLNDTGWYVSFGYVGSYVTQTKSLQTFFEEEIIPSLLYCVTGPTSTYPGKFVNNKGSASDYSVLQDGVYYQPFSYKIKSTRDISEYKDVVTTFAHPAGIKMFSEYSDGTEFNGQILNHATTVTVTPNS